MTKGYTHETILFLSADENNTIDIDGDGKFNEIDNYFTPERLEFGITEWASDAKDVMIYMTGHGNDGVFRINEDGFLSASNFASWLYNLKSKIPGNIVFVYDSCHSGSFMPHIQTSGIITITSSRDSEPAFFTSFGQLSFSSFFFDGIFKGGNTYDSFVIAKNSTSFTHPTQTPLLDDNGNGLGNEDDDGKVAKTVFIGHSASMAADIPTISSDAIHVSHSAINAFMISVDNVVSGNSIERVWAVITPPAMETGDPSNPVLDLPIIELEKGAFGYQGVFSEAVNQGEYNIAIFARDNKENLSFPIQKTFLSSPTQPSCFKFSDGLRLDIFCAVFRSDKYSFLLNYEDSLTWVLDIDSIGGATDDSVCASFSDDLSLSIPCASFMGDRYGFVLKYIGNPLTGKVDWEIDIGSINAVQ